MVKVQPTTQELQSQGFAPQRVDRAPSPESFGVGQSKAQLDQTNRGLIEQGIKKADEERAKANNFRHSIEVRAANDWYRENVTNPETGASGRKRMDAMGMQEELESKWSDFTKARKKGLANDEQKLRTKNFWDARRTQMLTWADSYAAKEIDLAEGEELDAMNESAKDRGADLVQASPAKVWRDMTEEEKASFNASLRDVQESVIAQGKRNNWGEEKLDKELQDNVSDFHVRVINTYIQKGDTEGAQEYFDDMRPQMDPDDANRVKINVDGQAVLQDAQEMSDKLFAQEDMTLGNAIDEANKIEDQALRKAVKAEIHRWDSNNKKVDAEERDGVMENGMELIRAGSTDPEKDMGEALWNKLKTRDKATLEKAAKKTVAPNDEAWMDYLRLVRDDPQKIADMPMADFYNIYWNGQTDRVKGRMETLRERFIEEGRKKGGVARSEFVTQVINVNKQINRAAIGAKMLDEDGRGNADQHRVVDQFEEEAQARYADWGAVHKQKPDYEQRKKLLGNIVSEKVFRDVPFFDPEVFLFQVDKDDRGNVYIADPSKIPPKWLENIETDTGGGFIPDITLLKLAGARAVGDWVKYYEIVADESRKRASRAVISAGDANGRGNVLSVVPGSARARAMAEANRLMTEQGLDN